MSKRGGHGAGRGIPRFETKPWDEQQRAPADRAEPLKTGRDERMRVRTTEAARALAKLPRRQTFVPRKLATDPRFEPHNRRRLEYLKRRRAELTDTWGGVSHGVGALLASEAWLWAAGEFASELGAETGSGEHFKTASVLYAQAKGLSAAAWEMASAEGEKRREANPGAAHAAAAALFSRPKPNGGPNGS
jgi:hypothetical protein